MNVDCRWIEDNLEALFCDRLIPEQDRLARSHMESCAECRNKVDELKAVDPLVKRIFRENLVIARTPRHRRSPVLVGVLGTALAVLLLLVFAPSKQPVNIPSPPPAIAATPQEAPIPKAKDGTASTDRAKPTPATPDRPAPSVPPSAPGSTDQAPEFLVTDLAGYSRSLNDYHGYVLIFGVWNSEQPESVANLERIYKAVGANTKLRVLGVSSRNERKPATATFPTANNQGSTLMGATDADFIIVDPNGTVQLRGSLLDKPSKVLSSVHSTLDRLGIRTP